MDREAWRAAVHGVTKSRTRPSDWTELNDLKPVLLCFVDLVTESRLTLCNSMDCSTSGFPVHHQLLELTQTHVHWVSDAIQPSHPLSSPSPAFNLSQQQGLFQWASSRGWCWTGKPGVLQSKGIAESDTTEQLNWVNFYSQHIILKISKLVLPITQN